MAAELLYALARAPALAAIGGSSATEGKALVLRPSLQAGAEALAAQEAHPLAVVPLATHIVISTTVPYPITLVLRALLVRYRRPPFVHPHLSSMF